MLPKDERSFTFQIRVHIIHGQVLYMGKYGKAAKGGYKTKTEDLGPKNEDPFKISLKLLKLTQA